MNCNFATINTIDSAKLNTWRDKLFLTFDIDWACDEVLSYTIDILEQSSIAATWFVTHETPILDRLRQNPKFELGIHPNFNFLLNGDPQNGASAEEVVDRMCSIVPEAKSVRGHSLTQSNIITKIYQEKGLTHESNQMIPAYSGTVLKPWIHLSGLTMAPCLWGDYLACTKFRRMPIEQLAQQEGLKVFVFHPIHVFLNTEHLDRYENTRSIHHSPEQLQNYRNPNEGATTILKQLIA